jgi:hypothetical protein
MDRLIPKASGSVWDLGLPSSRTPSESRHQRSAGGPVLLVRKTQCERSMRSSCEPRACSRATKTTRASGFTPRTPSSTSNDRLNMSSKGARRYWTPSSAVCRRDLPKEVLRPAPLGRALSAASAGWFVPYVGTLFRALAAPDLAHMTDSNPNKDYRFNRGTAPVGAFRVLYASTDRETPFYESRRRIQTAAAIIAVSGPATHLAIIDASLPKLLDLRQGDVCRTLRTNHQELTGNWWEFIDHREGAPTQWLGHSLHRLGIGCGLIYRSKYGTGDDVFVMHDHLTASGYLRPGDSEAI